MTTFRDPGPCGLGRGPLHQHGEPLKDLQLPWDWVTPYTDGLAAPRGFIHGSPCGYRPGPLQGWAKLALELQKWKERRAQDDEEFRLISAYVVGRIAGAGDYRAFADLDDYLEHRNKHFGTRDEYLKYAAESDQELTEELRGILNKPPKKLSPIQEQAAQAIFYRWLRKAYQKEFKVADVGADLKMRHKDYLALEALVKAKITKKLDWAFVPRPQRKADKNGDLRYLLGTVSNHARGIAVDISPGDNPDITPTAWNFIAGYLGTPFNRDLERWKKDPEGLFRDVKALSDGFAAKIATEADTVALYQTLLKEQKNAYCIAPQGDNLTQLASFSDRTPGSEARYLLYMIRSEGKDPFPRRNDIDKYIGPKFLEAQALDLVLDTALASYKGAKPTKDQLQKLLHGFFNLSADLVKNFRRYGFTWGVTYPSPDLMHFEADEKTPPLDAP